jgi:hypothetical protein
MEEMVSHLRQKARFRLKMLVVQLKRLKRLALRVRKTGGIIPRSRPLLEQAMRSANKKLLR